MMCLQGNRKRKEPQGMPAALLQLCPCWCDAFKECTPGRMPDTTAVWTSTELGENGIQSGLNLFQIIHIALDREAFDTEGANFFRDLVELFLASGKDRDVSALTGHGKCKTSSETDRCAGDNGNFSVKIKHDETS